MATSRGPRALVVVESSCPSDLTTRVASALSEWGYEVARASGPQRGDYSLGPDPDVRIRVFPERVDSSKRTAVPLAWDGPPTILIGNNLQVSNALAAERAGAGAVVTAPIDLDELHTKVSRAVLARRKHRRFRRMSDRIRQAGGPRMIWAGEPAAAWLTQLERIGGSAAPVMLWGEPGTGRRTLARAIHVLSPVGDGPFRVLIGHSGTGTEPRRTYDPERADGARNVVAAWREATGGSLFVHDLPLLDPTEQRALAGLLEAQTAGHGETPGVRLLVTCGEDPAKAVEEARLDRDLYYRIVFPLPTLPLRHRSHEVPAYATHFAREAAARHDLDVEGLADETLEVLRTADWPGNLPELRSAVERACILADSGWAEPRHLPPTVKPQRPTPPTRISIPIGTSAAAAERELILATLERTEFNKSEAARILDLDVKTVRNKLKAYGLAGPNGRTPSNGGTPAKARTPVV